MNVRRLLNCLDRSIAGLSFGCLYVAAACLVFMLTIGTANVITLNLFGFAIPSVLEVSEVLLAISLFFGFAFVQHKRQNIRFDALSAVMPARLEAAAHLIGLVLGTVLFSALAARSWSLAVSSWWVNETANALVAFPIYPAKFLVAIGAGIAALEFLRQAVRSGIELARHGIRPSPPHDQRA